MRHRGGIVLDGTQRRHRRRRALPRLARPALHPRRHDPRRREPPEVVRAQGRLLRRDDRARARRARRRAWSTTRSPPSRCAGSTPLVLAGHTHRRKASTVDGTLLLTEGSTGGAGLRGLEGEEPTPLELSVLYLDRTTHRLQAYDDITLGGLGATLRPDRADGGRPAEPSPRQPRRRRPRRAPAVAGAVAGAAPLRPPAGAAAAPAPPPAPAADRARGRGGVRYASAVPDGRSARARCRSTGRVLIVQRPRTPPFQGGYAGSNPVGGTAPRHSTHGTARSSTVWTLPGPVAQLVSAPPCHGGGRGFESRRGRSTIATARPAHRTAARAPPGQVAQLVEHAPEKRRVGGSIPSLTTPPRTARRGVVPLRAADARAAVPRNSRRSPDRRPVLCAVRRRGRPVAAGRAAQRRRRTAAVRPRERKGPHGCLAEQGWQRLADQGGSRPHRGRGRPRLGRALHHRHRVRPRRLRDPVQRLGQGRQRQPLRLLQQQDEPRGQRRAHRRQPHRRGRGRRRGDQGRPRRRSRPRSTRSSSRSRSTRPRAQPELRPGPQRLHPRREPGRRRRDHPLRPVRGRLDRDRHGLRRAVPQRHRLEVPGRRPGLRRRACAASRRTSASTSASRRTAHRTAGGGLHVRGGASGSRRPFSREAAPWSTTPSAPQPPAQPPPPPPRAAARPPRR